MDGVREDDRGLERLVLEAEVAAGRDAQVLADLVGHLLDLELDRAPELALEQVEELRREIAPAHAVDVRDGLERRADGGDRATGHGHGFPLWMAVGVWKNRMRHPSLEAETVVSEARSGGGGRTSGVVLVLPLARGTPSREGRLGRETVVGTVAAGARAAELARGRVLRAGAGLGDEVRLLDDRRRRVGELVALGLELVLAALRGRELAALHRLRRLDVGELGDGRERDRGLLLHALGDLDQAVEERGLVGLLLLALGGGDVALEARRVGLGGALRLLVLDSLTLGLVEQLLELRVHVTSWSGWKGRSRNYQT